MSLQDHVTLGVLCLAVGATAVGTAAATSLVIHLRRRSIRRQYNEIRQWIEEPPRFHRPETYQRHPWAGTEPVTTAEFFVAADPPPAEQHKREPILFDQEAYQFDPEPVLFDFDAEPLHPEPLHAEPLHAEPEPVRAEPEFGLDLDATEILPRLTDGTFEEIVPAQRRSPPPGSVAALAASGLTWPPVHPVAANGYLPNTAPDGRFRAGTDE